MLIRPAATLARRAVAGCLLAGITAVATTGPAGADTVRNQQMWVLDAMHAPAAWRVTQGQGVLVAVIDSGVNPKVPDLARSVVTGPDLTGLRTPSSDSGWGVHGTWMASLIAGHGHAGGGDGILGVAPRSRVLSIRVLADRSDPGYERLEHERGGAAQRVLAEAIRYAAGHGAQVISMSLGNGDASQPVRLALQHALDRGVVVVASAGNAGATSAARRKGQAPYSFPADYPGVLGVGAVNQRGEPAAFSSDNLSVQVSAPGVSVPAEGRDGQYWLVSGTSPACALTAGVAALIKARYPALAPALVVQAMTSTAQDPPPGGYDDRVGAGGVDAAAALAAAGRLARYHDTGSGLSVSARFGGGVAAIPPVPVGPRSRRGLVLYGLLVLGMLAATLAAARLLRKPAPAEAARPPSWPHAGSSRRQPPWPAGDPSGQRSGRGGGW